MGKNLLCILSSHKFGRREHVAPDSCKEVLICTRCRFTSWRELYQYGEWEHRVKDALVKSAKDVETSFTAS